MADPEKFKSKLESLIHQSHKVEFLGKNFDQIVSLLTEEKADKMHHWVQEVLDNHIQPITISSKHKYKDWTIRELLTFRYPFSIEKTEYRILLVKVKNSLYIEFHLGDHKYYDKVRKDLNLKKGSK